MDAVEKLLAMVAQLRAADNGCPWTQQLTFAKLAPYTLEEAHEISASVAANNTQALIDELGDLFYHLAMYAQIGKEQGLFDLNTIAQASVDKHYRRNPILNASLTSATAEEVHSHWQQQKQKEQQPQGTLANVPCHLPSHLRAHTLQARAAEVGFDWPSAEPIIEKLQEEITELEAELQDPESINADNVRSELGDILFCAINLCRKLNSHAEDALQSANQKFIQRFEYIETQLQARQQTVDEVDLETMEALWQESKTQG